MKPFIRGRDMGPDAVCFYNGKYQVIIRKRLGEDEREVIELSVRREDRRPIFDWRDMQLIKNEFFGPENEMVQLFPAESRLVDTSNQYWFYGYADGKRFPFGMEERALSENISVK